MEECGERMLMKGLIFAAGFVFCLFATDSQAQAERMYGVDTTVYEVGFQVVLGGPEHGKVKWTARKTDLATKGFDITGGIFDDPEDPGFNESAAIKKAAEIIMDRLEVNL